MAKADLGTKRQCPNCGAKYYDLNKSPAVCPKCGTPFEVTTTKTKAPKPEVAEEVTELEEVAENAPEVISLEEADAEAGADADTDDEDEEDIEVSDDDDTFLEDDEDEDEDVADIVGDVDDDDT